jgi:hypothetical protein
LMRLADAATVVDIDLQLSAGNRRQSRSVGVLRGCEGPRSVAKVASDPGAPSHFSALARQRAGLSLARGTKSLPGPLGQHMLATDRTLCPYDAPIAVADPPHISD